MAEIAPVRPCNTVKLRSPPAIHLSYHSGGKFLMFNRFAVAALALFSLALGGEWQQTLHVVPLPRDGELLVSFKLAQALTPELRKVIHSGLVVQFKYKIDLKRSSAVFIDRTMATAEVIATVKYDTLTRRYHLSRVIDGRIDLAPEPTDNEEFAWSWVTSQFDRLPLFRGVELESNAEYYVRVRAHTTPRNASFVWPWQGDDVAGFAKFTFIR
jgi:hypothetical protein